MGKYRILVVEDDITIAGEIRRTLEEFGYAVTGVVTTGEDAVMKAEEHRPDLVLINIGVKGRIAGAEAAGNILTSLEIPVIYLTSNTENALQGWETLTGPIGYLVKPFDKKELKLTVAMACYKAEAESRNKKMAEELQKTAHDLLASKSSFNSIVANNTDGIMVTGKDGRICFANPAAKKLFNRENDELVGEPFGIPLSIADNSFEFDIIRKDGTIGVGELQTIESEWEGENAHLVLMRDITDRKQHEELLVNFSAELYAEIAERKRIVVALDESERHYQSLFKNMLNAFAYCRMIIEEGKPLDFVFLAVNDAFEAQTGLKNVVNRKVSEVIPGFPETDSEIIELFSRVAMTGKPDRFEIFLNSLGMWFSSSVYSPARGHFVTVFDVITERKQLEAQLRHAQKMEAVGSLAGGVAHDFNNILNVIIGYGSMVYDGIEADSHAKEQMNEVLIAADRAANLTKRLLVFSRKQVVEVKSVNINELILGLQKMFVRVIRENIDFTLDLAHEPLIVPADAGLIEQVLINLAVNAKDAMQEGGRLTIGTGLEEMNDDYVAAYGYGKPGRYALITVSDTGHGIDAETQKKIFEPFFTTKGIGEGTGLGLAISYGIIKQHGGFINVYSEPGHGTVFKIYLPLTDKTASPDMKTDSAFPVKGGNETVLVAEDDASLRNVTRIILESFGYTVISAVDGEDAVSKFMDNKERVSLALIDMIMPKKNGKEAGEAMRRASPRIKILYESGYPMNIIKNNEMTKDRFDFIHKPFSPTDLLIRVREILDRRNAE